MCLRFLCVCISPNVTIWRQDFDVNHQTRDISIIYHLLRLNNAFVLSLISVNMYRTNSNTKI